MSRKINPNVQVQCPVCGETRQKRARCAQCHTDLAPLALVSAQAYAAREAARNAMRKGDFARAYRLAQKAQAYRRTPSGDRLVKLALMSWNLTL